jgi:hypothetical protein
LFLDSNDNFLEFQAFYDDQNDRFELSSVSYSDEKEKIPAISLPGVLGAEVTRYTYRDGSVEIQEPLKENDIPVTIETFSIEYEAGELPYLKYKLLETQRLDTRTIRVPGRRVGK